MAKEYELTEFDKEVVEDLLDTWNDIGYDVLQAVQEMDGKHDMPRSHVIDVVVDQYVGGWHTNKEKAERAKYLMNLPHHGKVRKAIFKAAFPYKHYGL